MNFKSVGILAFIIVIVHLISVVIRAHKKNRAHNENSYASIFVFDFLFICIELILTFYVVINFIFFYKAEDRERYASANGVTVSYSVNPEKTEFYANYIKNQQDELTDMVLISREAIHFPLGSKKYIESIQELYDLRFGEGAIKVNDITINNTSLSLNEIHEKIEENIAKEILKKKFCLVCILIVILVFVLKFVFSYRSFKETSLDEIP